MVVMQRCQFCDVMLDPNSRFTWHHVEGWERPGKAGGSDITLRKRTGLGVACDTCIRKLKQSVHPDQTTLV